MIFGMKRPAASVKPSEPIAEPSTSLPPFEAEAHRSLEESIHRLYEKHKGNKMPADAPSSEPDAPEKPDLNK